MIVCLVGMQGVGKTTFVKENFLNKTKKNKMIFCLVPSDFTDYMDCVYSEYTDFISKCATVKDTLIIIDEARAVIPFNEPNTEKIKNKNLINFILNSRKLNNFVVFIYHSLRDVPLWLITHCNYFLRFKTNDLLHVQRNRFLSFPQIIKSIDDNPEIEPFAFDEIKLR